MEDYLDERLTIELTLRDYNKLIEIIEYYYNGNIDPNNSLHTAVQRAKADL